MLQIKFCKENQNTNLCPVTFFFLRKSYRLWEYVEKYGKAREVTVDNIIGRMRFASWKTKTTDTHLEYVILNAFPQQQLLRERASCYIILHSLSCLFRPL